MEKTAKERRAERSVEVIRALQIKESHLGIVLEEEDRLYAK